MKEPSKSITKSLMMQKGPMGRMSEMVSVSPMKRGVSMIVPGDGVVDEPPGLMMLRNGERCSCHYTMPMRRYGGMKT